jgi:SAM-dependent methyltransferase
MDNYTKQIRQWLNQRYSMGDAVGHWDLDEKRGQGQVIYFAHQPVYGFEGGHCEPGTVARYAVTYHLLSALAHLQFDSVLDAGAAEGFTASVVGNYFNCSVRCVDLSEEACRRARALFRLDALPMDLHALGFADESFDVVLCSETLEHLSDPENAVREMLRVARKAVIISVPHEPEEAAERNRQGPADHAHIHSFDLHSFDGVGPACLQIRGYRTLSSLLSSCSSETDRCQTLYGWKGFAAATLRHAAEVILPGDAALCQLGIDYHGILAILLKPGAGWCEQPKFKMDAGRMLSWASRPLVLEMIDLQDLTDGAGSAPSIVYSLDGLHQEGEILTIRGWAFQDGRGSRFQRISLLFRSEHIVCMVPARTVERADVAAHFRNPEYRNAGFAFTAAGLDLPAGSYELGLFVRSPAGNSCRWSGRMMEFKASSELPLSDL